MTNKLYAGTALLSIVMMHAPASAQQASPPVVAETQETGLEEIIVTAQRKSENAQKAALAIDVVSAADLQQAGVVNSSTLNAVAPSLFVVQSGGATASYFVRGVGNFTNNSYSDPAIAFNYDGVYLGRPTSTTGTFYDLERIEVLKGPQGTLYGRNATGGAINVIPVKPQVGVFSGYASAGYGNYNALDLEAAVNAPIGEHGAIRLSGKLVNADGYNADGTSDTKSEAFRFQFLAEPTDGLSIRIGADYSHSGGFGPGASYDGNLRFSAGAVASATAPANYVLAPSGLEKRSGLRSPAAASYFSKLVIGGAFINPAPLNAPFLDDTYLGVNAEINIDTGIGKLTFIPAYRHAKLNNLFNGPSFRGGRVIEKDEQFSAELRLTGKALGPVDWLVGAYYFDERANSNSTFSQYFVQSIQNTDVTIKSFALFGRTTFNLSDRFRLVGAGRYTEDRKTIDGVALTLVEICANSPPAGAGCFGGPSVPVGSSLAEISSLIPASLLPLGFPTNPSGPAGAKPFGAFGNALFYAPLVNQRSTKNSRFTYRLAAEYDVGPNSLAYVSFETGYRSGGFSMSAGHETVEPEFIEALTLGLKNRFLDNRVQLNFEGFRWKYRDQQVSHFGLDVNGGNSFFAENIGRSTIQGVDIDLQFKATRNTLFNASVQYLENKLDSFVYNTARLATSLPPAVGCPYVPGVSGGLNVYVVDCSGKTGFNSPKWAINGGIEQTFELGNYNLVFNGNARYRSNRVTGFDYLAQQTSGEDVTFDASLKLASASDKWYVTAWVRNITNRDIPVNTQYTSSVAGTVTTLYAPPRTYGVKAGIKF
jgi:iron complex outermembrane recepter protein